MATTFLPSHAAHDPARLRSLLAAALMVFACAYNGALALVNANVMPMSYAVVALTETLILLAAGAIVLVSGLRRSDAWPLAFLFVSIILALFISLTHDTIFVNGLRNMLIPGIFMMLGARTDRRTFLTATCWLCGIVLAIEILEVISVPTYSKLFNPAAFVSATRGLLDSEYNDTGLFATSLGYEGRFSFGVTSIRASSIFLEAVSLGNFASLVALVIAGFWRVMTRPQRGLLIITAVFSILATNGRSASIMTLILAIGFFVFPLLPRWSNLAFVPATALVVAVMPVVTDGVGGDDFVGRINHAANSLLAFDAFKLAIGSPALSRMSYDSGYAFLLSSTSLWGALLFAALALASVPQKDAAAKRVAFGLSAYLLFNLVVSGTSVFSMKTAALLWFTVGITRGTRASRNK